MRELLLSAVRDRRLRAVVALFILFMLVSVVHSALTDGHIRVTTDDDTAQISLVRVLKTGERRTIKTTTGHLSAAVRGGDYIVSTHNRSNAREQKMTLKARQHITRFLQLDTLTLSLQSVLPLGVRDMVADNTTMLFIDESQQLTLLNERGTPTTIDPAHSYASAVWADTGFGVAKTTDGQLFTVRDGQTSQLSLPKSLSASESVGYSVTPSRLVYVSIGSAIYAGQEGLNFKKVTSVKGEHLLLAASDASLAIIADAPNPKNSQKPGGYTDTEKVVTVLTGKTSTHKEIEASLVSWSPNGKYLAVLEEFGIAIYNSELRQVSTIAQASVTNLAWADNQTLLYGVGSALWRHNVTSSQSYNIAKSHSQDAVTSLYVNADHSYVYVVTAGASDNTKFSTGRVGLTSATQDVPDYASALAIFFPSHSDQCQFSYNYFIKPVIYVTSFSDPATCLDAAKEELKADKLPVSDFMVVFAPGEPID